MVMRWRRPTLAWRQGSPLVLGLSTKIGPCGDTPVQVIPERSPLKAVAIGRMRPPAIIIIIIINERELLGRKGEGELFS